VRGCADGDAYARLDLERDDDACGSKGSGALPQPHRGACRCAQPIGASWSPGIASCSARSANEWLNLRSRQRAGVARRSGSALSILNPMGVSDAAFDFASNRSVRRKKHGWIVKHAADWKQFQA
jgi:hypothetical protein